MNVQSTRRCTIVSLIMVVLGSQISESGVSGPVIKKGRLSQMVGDDGQARR